MYLLSINEVSEVKMMFSNIKKGELEILEIINIKTWDK